jgi:succinate dehydrogenase / fumarate reductase cytochrome b subunit
MMRYAFFPGCVLEGAASEAREATVRVARALDIELVELPGWTCCGASHAQDVDELAALAVNARNLVLAEKLGLPLLTACSTCTLMLRKAKAELDGGLKDKVNGLLAAAGMSYAGTATVSHLLWALVRDYGLDRLQARVTRPLTGLKVAGYYGCHLLRPPQIMDFEDHARPRSLAALITALGAAPVELASARKCCGFHAVFPAERDVFKMTGAINADAVAVGADCVVTPCPLCQMQLDMRQPEGKAATGTAEDMPVLHLAQLVGLALGMTGSELGLGRHVTAAGRVAAKAGGR